MTQSDLFQRDKAWLVSHIMTWREMYREAVGDEEYQRVLKDVQEMDET